MKTRILFIINPISGGKYKKDLPDKILALIDEEQLDVDFDFTDAPGHGIEIAKEAVKQNFDIVVAVGGDGTINEVAQGLLGSDIPMGIIPMGSGNGLARHLNLPTKLSKALNVITKGKHKTIDTATFNDTPFLCTAGLGFDAEIAHKFDQADTRGLSSYAKETIASLKQLKKPQFRIHNNGKSQTVKAYLITLANASQWGNNFFISPQSSMSDGQLNCCIVKPFPLWYAPIFAYHLVNKTIQNSPYYESFPFTEIEIEADCETHSHLDGEPHRLVDNAIIRVKKDNLTVLC